MNSLTVHVRASGKVNLSLRVGPLEPDGYHPLLTVFQAVALPEDVFAREADPGEGISLTVAGVGAKNVPTDHTNLAWRAAARLADYAGIDPDVRLRIVKGVPVAGGMAGGSADAAATLVACDALWHTGLTRTELGEVGAALGADVPFALMGHTAIGTGRGHILTPAMVRGEYHWAFAVVHQGLSTPAVFRAFDALTAAPDTTAPGKSALRAVDTELLHALRLGDPAALGRALHNDLQPAAFALRPELAETFDVARDAQALGVILSGSGPTIAALARSSQHALAIAAAWNAAQVCDEVYCATSPAPGARVVTGFA